MARINAAWGLIGDPAERRRVRPGAARGDRRRAGPHARRGFRFQARRLRPGRAPDTRRLAAGCQAHAAARCRIARLDLGPLIAGRWLRRVDARGRGLRGRRAAARSAVGQRPQLRALRRLVPRRDRPPRPRVHRVARSNADRAQLPRRGGRAPAVIGPAPVGCGRGRRPSRPVPRAALGSGPAAPTAAPVRYTSDQARRPGSAWSRRLAS